MGRFEQMRDRLPTLYRPDDGHSDGDLVTLRASDIRVVEVEPELAAALTNAAGGVVVALDEPGLLRRITLEPGRVAGPGYVLECYQMRNGQVLSTVPTIAAPVRDNVAAFPSEFTSARFAVRLRRGSKLALFLHAAAAALETLNREASDVLQSHWFAFADRAVYSPYYIRGRQLRGLPPPRSTTAPLQDPAVLIVALQAAADPLAQFIRAQLSSAMQQAVDAYEPGTVPPQTLVAALTDTLNTLVEDETLYLEERFAHVALSPDVMRLLGQDLQGGELVRRNWMLLEEAYPRAIVRSHLDFPYIHDLGRLAALLGLPPWREPPLLRERVEPYRERIRRIVRLYQNGVGTLDALRSMVEAQLPIDFHLPAEQHDRPFWLEEFAPRIRHTQAIQARGEPLDMVGPMMRWTLTNDGLTSAPPTIYIQGVTPQPELIDPTAQPLIELYTAEAGIPPLGIAYSGTLAPDQTLRLRPAAASWLGRDDGVQRAESLPSAVAADPTAPGPWQAVPGAPAAPVVAIHQAHDRALWVATGNAGAGELWRFDGTNWTTALSGQPQIHALAETSDRQALLIGTANGLLQMPLFPAEGDPFAAAPVAGLDDRAIFALAPLPDGTLWVGSAQGASQFGSADPPVLPETEVYAISLDRAGTRCFGTNLGLFQHQPATDAWYWYEGRERTEQQRDWQPLTAVPTAGQVFLPPVRCVLNGLDASLWLGTDNGIARYIARPVRGLSYETVLEAFPDLTTGQVFTIRLDERGLIWFGTARGLFRYDGRDMWQYQGDAWVQLGRASLLYGSAPEPQPRGTWRFARDTNQWQRYDALTAEWLPFTAGPRTTDEAPVRALAWTDGVVAQLGTWDGSTFTPDASLTVPAGDLRMRCKPNATRIVTGGIPAIPRMPVGTSTWRYLALEPDSLSESTDRPAWTMEGRLLPPPPDLTAPDSGRYDHETPPPPSDFDETIFAFNPAAQVWFSWEPRRPLTVLVRLQRRASSEAIDPAILDRVWQGIQQVRPAGVRVVLAVAEEIVRGTDDAPTS